MMFVAPEVRPARSQANTFICGLFVWNAVRHDEGRGSHCPRPSDFKGGLVDNLEPNSCDVEPCFCRTPTKCGKNNRRRVMGE